MLQSNEPRYQVFVSSTFADLQAERQAALRAILETGSFPAGMELFPSTSEEQWTHIKREIDSSDYYLLIVAGRYGSVSSDGRSFTEKEYDYAVEAGKPILAFLFKDLGELRESVLEENYQKKQQLGAFRARLQANRLVSFYKNADDLHAMVLHSLWNAFKSSPQDGWKRGTAESVKGPIQGGLVEFRKSFEGLSYEAILRESTELLVVLNDGRSWIDSHRESLDERTRVRGNKTTFLLIHPKSDFLPVLLRKNGKRMSTQVDELRRSVEIIEMLKQWNGSVEVRGHYLFNPYAMFLGDQLAMVMPYFLNEAGQLPVCIFQRDEAGTSLYWRYQRDALALFKQSVPLGPDDFREQVGHSGVQPPPTNAAPSRTSGDIPQPKSRRQSIFISYSHRDKKWFEELKVSLKPYVRDEGMEIWDDTRISTGGNWKQEIESALYEAKVAVLLVSRYFFSSDFIAHNELQPLLEAAEKGGLRILWIAVSASPYERSKIGAFQAANDPLKPLDTLNKAQRNGALVRIAEEIRKAVDI